MKETLDKIVEQSAKIKADFEAKDVNTVDFAKKLLGQIVFLYFLQKKGWFGVERDAEWGTGTKQFLRELFQGEYGKYGNFFNDILEPLFYEALRTDHRHDDDYYSRFNCKIPFLNGGLFDPIGGYDWVHTDILLPNELFSNENKNKEGDTGNGILDIFDRYNFTVKEDEPLEKEVAVDPEMLGKVFENLLEVKDRKSKGTYYTPREIVHYMCQQSLINYLNTELNKGVTLYQNIGDIQTNAFGNEAKVGQLDLSVKYKLGPKITKEDIKTLIKYGEQFGENEATVEARGKETGTYSYKLSENIRRNAKLIDEKLASIKVCDPAIGSGAFPVGMMHEIVRVRDVLSAFIAAPDRTVYHFKRECIEKSLYGVDIDPGAVEIAKLRLWLSLVVDEEDIRQIKPLPNLDYKIVCGNSLLGYPYTPMGLGKIEKLKELFFYETRPQEKNELREQINHSIYDLFRNTEESLGYKVTVDFKINFSEVFNDKKGFDVVIANPPYVGQKGNNFLFKPVKKSSLGRFHQRRMDYFYFFFHLALDIGKNNSVTSFISTNYYPTATYADKLRTDFRRRSIVKNLMNFNELRIFESALGQHNMITILEKAQSKNALTQTCITQRQGLATPEILHQILIGKDTQAYYYIVMQKDLYDGDEYYIRLAGSSKLSGNPIQTILHRIKRQTELLGNLFDVIQGIVTGADKVSQSHIKKYGIRAEVGDGIFVLSEKEAEWLLAETSVKEIIKPWFKNSDIYRWSTRKCSKDKLVYYTSKGKYSFGNEIEKHFENYKKILINRNTRSGTGVVAVQEYDDYVQNKGYISYVMIASSFKKGKYYCISYARDPRVFEGNKIVAPQRSPRNTFGYNEIPWYASADVYFITGKEKLISLKYILALLNSKLYYLWLYHRGKRKGEMLELYQKPLSEIPIKKIHESEQKPFITLVDRILAITKDDDYLQNLQKQTQVKALEEEIDQMVYKLYGLTEEEIGIVEGEVK